MNKYKCIMVMEEKWYVVYRGNKLGLQGSLGSCLKAVGDKPYGFYKEYNSFNEAVSSWMYYKKHGEILEVKKARPLF